MFYDRLCFISYILQYKLVFNDTNMVRIKRCYSKWPRQQQNVPCRFHVKISTFNDLFFRIYVAYPQLSSFLSIWKLIQKRDSTTRNFPSTRDRPTVTGPKLGENPHYLKCENLEPYGFSSIGYSTHYLYRTAQILTPQTTQTNGNENPFSPL